LNKQIKDSGKLGNYLALLQNDVLDKLDLFRVAEEDDEYRQEELAAALLRYRVNLVVDNDG
jgi:hypothetical protein